MFVDIVPSRLQLSILLWFRYVLCQAYHCITENGSAYQKWYESQQFGYRGVLASNQLAANGIGLPSSGTSGHSSFQVTGSRKVSRPMLYRPSWQGRVASHVAHHCPSEGWPNFAWPADREW